MVADKPGQTVEYPLAHDATFVRGRRELSGLELRANMMVRLTIREGRIIRLEDLASSP